MDTPTPHDGHTRREPRPTIVSTSQLLGLISQSSHETARDLAALGLALHLFIEPAHEHADRRPDELDPVTFVLARQIGRLLDDAEARGRDPLAAVPALVTNPDRTATRAGDSAAAFCGPAWNRVRALAAQRARQTVEGAARFGADALLTLAAMSACRVAIEWWGEHDWASRLDRHLATEPTSPPSPATGDTPSGPCGGRRPSPAAAASH